MSHLTLLIPFGLPPEELAADLIRQMDAPAGALFIARGRHRHTASDPFARALPHEDWLARRLGLAAAANGSPALAAAAMRAFGLQPDGGAWFVLQPAHLHVARDHLVLTDLRQLTLTEAESRTLFERARQLAEEIGKTLLYGDAHTWFLRADDWSDLKTSTPDAACGHNVDIWMPTGTGERAWRKLQNEVQMDWHAHPINQTRESRGIKTVNSIWLWGGAPGTPSAMAPAHDPLYNPPAWLPGLHQCGPQAQSAADLKSTASGNMLAVFDHLTEAALAGDWAQWLAGWGTLENDWLAPLASGFKDKRIDRLTLVLSHQAGLSEFELTRHSPRKFWIKPSLTKLKT